MSDRIPVQEEGHDERPTAKSWNDLSADRDKLDSKLNQCLKDDNHDASMLVCTGKLMDEWNAHLNDVSKKAHVDMRLAPEEDRLLTDSEKAFSNFMNKEQELIGKISPGPDSSPTDNYAKYSVIKSRAESLSSNTSAATADKVEFDDVYTNKCLQKSRTPEQRSGCIDEGLAKKHKALVDSEKRLRGSLMDPTDRKLLKEDGTEFREFYNTEINYINKLHPSKNGLTNEIAAREKMRILEDRTKQLDYLFLQQRDRPENR